MRHRTAAILAAILLVAVLAGSFAVLRGRSTPMPEPTPTVSPNQIQYEPVPAGQISPVVVQRMPARGEELRPDGALALVFDRAMDKPSVEAALQIAPAVSGTIAWPDARTIVFTPKAQLPRAAQFGVTLGQGAQAQNGAKLAEPLRFSFNTSGYLEAGQVIPANAAQDVATTSQITVLFNRPVVPLTPVEQQGNLPQPLSFEPAIEGRSEWLNTAIYVFTPAQPLQSGTNYTARVAPDLKDATGNPMQSAFSWQFSTARPQVLAITPQDGASGVSVEPIIRVQFNGPVGDDVRQTVLRDSNGAAVPARVELLTDTLLLTPSTRLAFDTSYRVEVPAGVGAATGGAGLAEAFASSFRTAPLPKILSTTPADGATDVPPWPDFAITFNAPIDPDTVMPNIRITPGISATGVYTYYDETSYTFHIGIGERPSTDFTFEIGPNIADRFGNTTGQSLTVRFRTGPLPPNLYIAMPGVATYATGRPARVAVQTTNVGTAEFTLYRLPQDTLKQPIYRLYDSVPNGSQEIRRWTAALNAPPDKNVLNQVDLLENSGSLEAGMYLVRVNGPNFPQSHILLVSPLHVTLKSSLGEALVWANDMQSGAPAANVTFDIYEEGETPRLLGSSTTDGQGVARLKLERTQENGLIAVAREPFAAMGSNWAQSINRWEFSPSGRFYAPGLFAYAYTDRPIYRPGQQVHFKGLVRNEDDAQFTLPQNANLTVTVVNPNGETVFTQPMSLNANGMFAGDVALPDGAPLGDYQIGLQIGDRSFSNSFKVAAYRPPEFEVKLTPNQPQAFRGEAIGATVQSSYLFGAPLANASVTWNVLAEPYRFAPEWAARFQFGEQSDWGRCWECWWLPTPPPEPILQGEGTTDAQGNLAVTIPADVLNRPLTANQRQPANGGSNAGSYRLTIEAVVTGRDNQVIAGRGEVVVHAAGAYVGLAAQTYVGTVSKEQKIEIVTASTTGAPLPNQPVALEFQRVTWESRLVKDDAGERWESTEKVETIGTQTVTTDANAQATAGFTPDAGGAYRVVARARDTGGREARSSLTTWVAGSDYVPWARENSDRITLVADKTSYKPGETAQILIPSPFQGQHYALITVERAGIRSAEVRQMSGNSIVFQLPLTEGDAPNVYVSAMLFKGGENTGLADFKVGVLPITVEPVAQTLDVKLTSSVAQAEPGAQIAYDVQVTNANGQGVAAELSVDLVDKGVLSLAPRQANEMHDVLYEKRSLGVATSSALSISGERTLEQVAQATGGGRGGGGDTASSAGGAAPAAAMPTAAPAAEAADAAANRSQQQGPAPTVRENFADTAYWNASISTDSNGRGRVELTLPDNLTTWVMRAVGLTDDTHAGEGTVELVATKPLLIRPVTPRFFTVGDSAELAANVTNNTDAPLDAIVSLAANGMTVAGEITQTLQIPARGESQVRWNATALDTTLADLTFTATAGNYADASKPRLAGANGIPIFRYSAPEAVGTGGQLGSAGARGEVVALPPNVDKRNGELTVRLDPSLASGLRDGLRALEHYEYECAEQSVSRFLPNVLTAQALKELGVPNSELEAKLPGLVDEGVKRLAAQQNGDGGWGWWPQGQSNPHVSAYAVFGLARAKAAGYSVPDDMLARAQDYLTAQLKPTNSANARANLDAREANQQAFILFAMAESGRGDAGKAGELFETREKLAVYARALLAMALNTSGTASDDSRIKALLSDLNNAAIMSATGAHWEESERDYWSMNTNTRTTAIALEALARLDAKNQLNANVVRWLMVARKDGAWETTQESAWSLMGLTTWLKQTGELQGAYDYGVKLNNTELTSGRVSPQTIDQPVVLQVKVADMLLDAGNVLTIARGDGTGQLYYTAHLRAFLPVEAIKALDRGIVISRRYVLASCTDGAACPEVKEAKVGDVLRVELSIVAPNDLHYLAVEDPLPAGVEAIDPNLATTSLVEGSGVRGQGSEFPIDGVSSEPRSLIPDPWQRWYARTELRDEKVALFADYLPKGAYTFSYTVRATQAGDYRAIPTTASEMYFPEVYGRGDAATLRIQNE